MRNPIHSLTLVSLVVACSSSTVTQSNETLDGGTRVTGGNWSLGGARTGTGGRTSTIPIVAGGGQASLGGSGSTLKSSTNTGGASHIGGTGAGASTTQTGTGTNGGIAASGGTLASGGAKPIGGTSAVGATSATGGAGSTGGTSAVGATSATGGAKPMGGTSAVGATSATGGAKPMGGTSAVGATSATGGAKPMGGTTASIGGSATGGALATGGLPATGGLVATGGSTASACTGQTKPCNGSCVPLATCCGGCSGDTPVCSDGTCVGRPNGEGCSTPGECASKVCADGVCCNVACDGQCEACNLAASNGTCSPSTTARTNQPCASDGSVCGGSCDGTAAHRKACVYPANTTLCGPGASCNSSTNQASTAQLCNGSGLCNAPTVKNCAPYTCNGTVCGTSCPSGQGVCGGSCVDILSDPAHCGGSCTACPSSTPKCYSGSCVQCTMGSDCATLGYGSGSVCTSNRTCQCHPPSSGNLLDNPGFDGSLSGWTLRNCPSGACPSSVVDYQGDYDYESCPGSGSVHLTYYAFEFGAAAQCVAAEESKSYRFGYSYRQMSPDPNAMTCYVDYYAGSTCSGTSLDSTSLQSGSVPFGSWSTALTTFFTPASTGSIQISCQSNSIYDAWIDQVYLNGSSGYF